VFAQYEADIFNLRLYDNSPKLIVENEIYMDTTLQLNNRLRIFGLSISGTTCFNNNEDSYVRITLLDQYDYEYLVYENYPILADELTTKFSNVALETVFLADIVPQSLKITLYKASIKLDCVNYSISSMKTVSRTKTSAKIQQEQKKYIIDKLNSNLEKCNKTWRAGVTALSEKSFAEKKEMFGGNLPELFGFEYYKGGIFVWPDSQKSKNSLSLDNISSPYVNEWDWRNRHGKNWITSVKFQGLCGSCWAHAAVGVLEAYINLYYNMLLNYDLSEEEIISCSNFGCGGGFEQFAFDYIAQSGIVDENCFQYTATEKDCSMKCSNPSERIFIDNYGYYETSESEMKRQLFRAPITIGLSMWRHSIVLAGFKTIRAGDVIYNANTTSYDSIVIDSVLHASLIGRTAWLIKNSWGSDWGDGGYGFIIVDESNINAHCYLQGGITSDILADNDIACTDADGDGLYFWGIGPKPVHCPSWVSDEPDGDDSNINYGSLDVYGNLDTLPYGITINTPSTYAYNNTISYRLGIVDGGVLTITGTTTLSGNAVIRVCEGGKLIVDGGMIQNADIVLVPGCQLVIRNEGKISMAAGKVFEVPKGVVVNIESGEID
jgi:C1A family cysteine protease